MTISNASVVQQSSAFPAPSRSLPNITSWKSPAHAAPVSHNMKRILVVTFIVLAAIIALIAFRPSAPTSTVDPEVGVTIFPVYDIVRTVAGDAVDVGLLLPPGASPHTYEPTPSDIAAINDAAVIYRIGFGLDDWATLIANTTTDVQTLADDITLRTLEGSVDPHYWLSVPNGKRIAAFVAADLAERFPDHQATFQTNLATYLAALDTADAQIRAMIDKTTNTNIVTMHDAWYYFAEEYGLNVIGTFEPEAAEEPTPQQLAMLQNAITAAGVHTVYVDADASVEGITPFADDNGLQLVIVDAEGVTYNSYIDLMLGNAQLISENR